MRVAGYHGGASADVQKLRYRVGNEAYARALKEGAAAKARGDVCHCIDCYNERLAAKESEGR